MEEKINFESGGLTLEGCLTIIDSSRAAIITHPHTLYGGEMANPVVAAIAEAYQKNGWSTLRFNFRGAGGSEGRFDNGPGEQNDVDAAIAWMEAKGFRRMELAGYSFGAWVLAGWSQTRSSRGYTLRFVAPPTPFMDFSGIGAIPDLKQVIAGSRDEIASPDSIESALQTWRPQVEIDIVPQADHFFGGHLSDLQKMLGRRIGESARAPASESSENR